MAEAGFAPGYLVPESTHYPAVPYCSLKCLSQQSSDERKVTGESRRYISKKKRKKNVDSWMESTVSSLR